MVPTYGQKTKFRFVWFWVWLQVKDLQVLDHRFGFSMPKSPRGQKKIHWATRMNLAKTSKTEQKLLKTKKNF